MNMGREKVFCASCNTFVDYMIHYEDVTQKVKEDTFTLNVGVPRCVICQNEVFVEEVDQKSQEQFFNAYRDKHNIILTKDIISIRKKMKLSQRDFSRLLGLGEISISRYELGSIPSQAISTLIFSSQKIETLKSMYEGNNHLMSDDGKKKIETFFAKHNSEMYTGNRPFNSKKLYELIYLLTREATIHQQKIYPTKMNKLLFYVDFNNYKVFNQSMTGASYLRLPYGPVLKYSDYHYEMNDLIKLESDDEKRWMVPKDSDFKITQLSEQEVQLALSVYAFFSRHHANDISEYSHQEKAWKDTVLGHEISYAYALEMEQII
jgi:putative zinc finger/helix-turn-helix YgiT family protein